MSIPEAKVISFQYPEVECESESFNWAAWSVDQGEVGSGAEGKNTTPVKGEPKPDKSAARSEGELDTLTRTPSEENDQEALRRAFEEGRATGHAEGLVEGRAEGEAAGRSEEQVRITAERECEKRERTASAADMINGFYREQERYLHQVEQEVARLALAISARILRREAEMDPLFLTGAVRVALGQLSESTQVVLHVPEADLGLWTDAMRLVPNLTNRPTVVAGEGMMLGECRVQTEMGSADLGVKAQLAEIERGFFDSMYKREAVNQSQAKRKAQETLAANSARTVVPPDPVRTDQNQGQNSRANDSGLHADKALEGQYLDEPADSIAVESTGVEALS